MNNFENIRQKHKETGPQLVDRVSRLRILAEPNESDMQHARNVVRKTIDAVSDSWLRDKLITAQKLDPNYRTQGWTMQRFMEIMIEAVEPCILPILMRSIYRF